MSYNISSKNRFNHEKKAFATGNNIMDKNSKKSLIDEAFS
jgi:hypothetical protein